MTKISKNKQTSIKAGGGSGVKKTAKADAKAPAQKAKAKPAAKADAFSGTTKQSADKPAPQLPRSGWSSTEEFKKAARASRDLAGLQAGGLPDRPIIRPMYGLPVPVPLPHMKDKDIEAAVKGMMGDRRISLAEVNKLIDVAKDNGRVTKSEKADLKRLMDNAGQFFDLDALHKLQSFLKDEKPLPDPVIRPMYGLPVPVPLPTDVTNLKDKDLAKALKGMLGDRKISLAEVNELIKIANDNGGISTSERADLEKLYDQAANFFDGDAHFKLGQAIGREPVIRPLYGIAFPVPLPELKDKTLKEAAKDILKDRKISSTEVDGLIQAAKDNRGLSKTERADLNRLLSEVGEYFEPAAKTKLQAFLGTEGADGLKITQARRDHILGKVEKAETQGLLGWKNTQPPLGVRFVEVPLKQGRTDMHSYTALIPVGALAPGAPTADPNKVDNIWVRRSGGLAGLTEYVQLNVA